jgi:hypothetical protein
MRSASARWRARCSPTPAPAGMAGMLSLECCDSRTELRNLELVCPPLPEQTAIATILSDMDAEIAALEEKLAKARNIKQGMMQELLTGRIRLL